MPSFAASLFPPTLSCFSFPAYPLLLSLSRLFFAAFPVLSTLNLSFPSYTYPPIFHLPFLAYPFTPYPLLLPFPPTLRWVPFLAHLLLLFLSHLFYAAFPFPPTYPFLHTLSYILFIRQPFFVYPVSSLCCFSFPSTVPFCCFFSFPPTLGCFLFPAYPSLCCPFPPTLRYVALSRLHFLAYCSLRGFPANPMLVSGTAVCC
jgi:hypothetical protein